MVSGLARCIDQIRGLEWRVRSHDDDQRHGDLANRPTSPGSRMAATWRSYIRARPANREKRVSVTGAPGCWTPMVVPAPGCFRRDSLPRR